MMKKNEEDNKTKQNKNKTKVCDITKHIQQM